MMQFCSDAAMLTFLVTVFNELVAICRR